MKKFRIMTCTGPVAIEGDNFKVDSERMLIIYAAGEVVAVFSDWRYWTVTE